MIETYFTIKTVSMIISAAAFLAVMATALTYELICAISEHKRKRDFDKRRKRIEQELAKDRERF